MKKISWLAELQSFAGVVIGLIMLSIGAVMFLNAGAKIFVLGYESSEYFSAEDHCEDMKIYPSFPDSQQEKTFPAPNTHKKSEQEMNECIAEAIEEEKKRYRRDKFDTMLDGAILIIVGFPLWFFHRRRKK